MAINEIRGLGGFDSVEPVKPVRRTDSDRVMSEEKPYLTAKERAIEKQIADIAEIEYRLGHEELAPNTVQNLKAQLTRRRERLDQLRNPENNQE